MRKLRLWIWGVGGVIVLALVGANIVLRMRTPDTAPAMAFSLRDSALKISPADVGLPANGALTVHGVVVDMPLDSVPVTLVALANGDANLLYSSGGGVLGGADANVQAAAKALIATAQSLAEATPAVSKAEIPPPGQVRITLLTNHGNRGEVSQAGVLLDGSDRLAPVFKAADEVVLALKRPGPK